MIVQEVSAQSKRAMPIGLPQWVPWPRDRIRRQLAGVHFAPGLSTVTHTHKTCYACEAQATSREHVPPLCLFPTARDSDGQDLRRNLITVPSHEAHNLQKSKDDEFLMVSIAGIFGNNSIGFRHKLGLHAA